MAEESSGRRLSRKLTLLMIGLWAFNAFFSLLFVNLVFSLSGGQVVAFAITFMIGAGLACGLSVFLVRTFCKPLVLFLRRSDAGQPLSETDLENVARVARSLYLKIGLVGLIGPILLLFVVSILLHLYSELILANVLYFVILGLFDSMFMASILLLVPQMWLGEVKLLIARHRGGTLGGRVVPLRNCSVSRWSSRSRMPLPA